MIAQAEIEPRPRAAALWSDTWVYATRNAAHIRQIPEKLLDVTVQPLMFVLLFAYVFGGAIAVAGGNYREYLLGGILVQSIAFGLVGPAVSIATDLTEGVIDRFRSLPSSRLAYLFGHSLAEMAGMVLAIVILLGAGVVVGWRTHASPPEVIVAFLLLLAFAAAMIWTGTLLGLIVRAPDAVMGIAFTIVFPITFISNAFVPIDSLPPVLRHFAAWNPVSVVVSAVRDLFGNTGSTVTTSWPLQHAVPLSFLSCALILAVTVPAALHRFRVRTES